MFSWLRFSAKASRTTPARRKAAPRTWSLEPLEERRMLAIDMLLDVAPGASSSHPESFIQVGDIAYFIADDQSHGVELWKTDGTTAGTEMVTDIAPGADSSTPLHLTAFNGKLYFTADDQVNGRELWMSDGTAAGTEMVLDIRSGLDSSSPEGLTVLGNELVFSAETAALGRELWKTDGTGAGTVLVADLRAGNTSSNPMHLTKAGTTIFFAASNSDAVGNELWKYEGGSASLVRNIADLSFEDSNPENFFAVGSKVYFTANGPSDFTFGRELWVSDGTSNGTYMLKDINPNLGSSNPTEFFHLNGTTYFAATTADEGRELWKTDGTSNGTVLVNDYTPGSGDSNPISLAAIGDDLIVHYDTYNYLVVYRANSTVEYRGNNLKPGGRMIAVNDKIYFSRADIGTNYELYEFDGTTVSLAKDIHPAFTGSNPNHLTVFGNNLLFSANDGTHGTEPWMIQNGPVPSITGLPPSNTIAEGLEINLSPSLTLPGGGAPYTYAWTVQRTGDSGDYATGTDEDFSFTPDNNGTYTVTLEVTDSGNGVGQSQAVITVTNAAPTVTISGPSGANIGSLVTLTSQVNDVSGDVTAGFTYSWILLKDNVQIDTGSQADFSFTFAEDATYVAELTVSDQDNGDGVASHTVLIAAVDYVDRSFLTALGRNAEQGAVDYYRQQLENGATYQSVASEVLSSSEYHQDRVEHYYQQILQRAADTAGLDYWTARLQAGMSEFDLQTNLMFSAEYRDQFANNQDLVNGLYQTILGRAADTDGLNYWSAVLDQAAPGAEYDAALQQVIRGLLGSSESVDRQINQLYQTYLGRAAEQGALDYWRPLVQNGTISMETLVLELMISAEFINQV